MTCAKASPRNCKKHLRTVSESKDGEWNAMSIEYKLCTAETAAELNRQVNELLGDGWVLYGNPFFTAAGLLCQALTKLPKKVAGVR